MFSKRQNKRVFPGKSSGSKRITDRREGSFGRERRLERKKYKWTTIQSYYVMFHAARALLYAKNYREKNHYCLIIALKHLYVDPGKLPVYFIEALQKGKALREDADYYDDWSQIGSEETLKLAEEFLNKAKELIKENSSID